MIELGKYQTLEVVKKTDFGFYLSDSGKDSKNTVLLPVKEAPEGIASGDTLKVFIYKDSEDRIIATTTDVPVAIGSLAVLRVKEVNKVGAFLDWGLMKDLLLPYKEQTYKVEEGMRILVTLYIDKSDRLCATMKVYSLLSSDSPYHKNDRVTGTVYEELESFGVFVAVDNKYSALLPKNELFAPLKPGDIVKARVVEQRPDGKLTLSLREKSYVQSESDSELILIKLRANNGYLPYNDNSSPEVIKTEFKMSKNAFKRAIGNLYKAGKIKITVEGIQAL